MSDDRKDEPPPIEGLPPYFPMVEDGYELVKSFASRLNRAHAKVLSATTGVSAPPLALAAAAAIPSLLLQAVVVPGTRTSEGWLIEAVAFPWFEIVKLITDDPNLAYQLSSDKWEEIIAGVYKRAGFEEVTLTPRSGDHGRDVIAIKKARFHPRDRSS